MKKPRRSVATAIVVVVALLMSLVSPSATPASALMQANTLVINEIVAANDSFRDSFDATPDWIEIRNIGSESINLADWTLADDTAQWVFPSRSISAGQHLVVFASDRDLPGSELHTNFKLGRSGETVSLASPDGVLIDQLTYPALADDIAYGRGSDGGIGVLLYPTPNTLNRNLAPAGVTFVTPQQTFVGTLAVTMVAPTQAGEQIRFTTDSTPVTATSPVYTGAISLTTSTVIRAAVVGNGVVGPESSTGYIAVSPTIENFSSDLPLVIVHATGPVSYATQDAIVSVIDRGPDGRTDVFDESDYMGFAGLRLRGASSSGFEKLQYKFELWGDRLGNEVPANLLGLGSDSDWGLYAPGRFDKAMINNPLVYELAKRIGVVAPDYQFVELFIGDDPTGTVGEDDYFGLFVLRETIKISENSVDIAKHTSTTAGPDGGYILRYDWKDDCCANIDATRYFSQVAVDSPSQNKISSSQLSYIDGWWDELKLAASTSFEDADQYIEFDSFIDHWLLEILAFDTDLLRASHYFHLDAGGQLQGGPVWDYDRGLGGDSRVDELFEAQAWKPNGSSGHSYESEIYEELWAMPEVQARLRARWVELRNGTFSDAELTGLITQMGGEIAEAYVREDARWGSFFGYGSRYGGLSGEIDNLNTWIVTRATWIDEQFAPSTVPPQLGLPAELIFEENVPVTFQIDVSPQPEQGSVYLFDAAGLPEGLSINESSGLISGTVAYGDANDSFLVTITVTDPGGASDSDTMTLRATAPATRQNPLLLNEYNAVEPGRLLESGGGDSTFGTTGGNGGNWFELVVMQDNLDLRGYSFETWSNNDEGTVVQTSNLVLGQAELLSSVRAGSIVTVAESVPDDLSYDPGADDWTINLQANDAQEGSLWSTQSDFDTNNTRWRLVIRDQFGAVAATVLGETTPAFDDPLVRVNNSQVWAVFNDPTPQVSDLEYGPTVASTFGAPNTVSLDGEPQDFSLLRPIITVLGDANCSGAPSISDAIYIAQFSVGNRDDVGTCPLNDPKTEINASAADVNGNGRVSIQDALMIARCAAGNPNEFCPE